MEMTYWGKRLALIIGLACPVFAQAVDTDGDGFGDAIETKFGFDANDINDYPSALTFEKVSQYNGDNTNAYFGYSAANAGDVNNDGVNDLISGTSGGLARVISGKDGTTLYTFSEAAGAFGQKVAGAGDVNKDGYDDVIVSAHRDGTNGTDSGAVWVYSGIDGSVLYTIYGEHTYHFGFSAAGAGDINKDGYADIIVGALAADNSGQGSGSARIFSGQTGNILYTLNGDTNGDMFGYSVDGAGDLNKDGYDDVIISALIGNYTRVVSGIDGSTLTTLTVGANRNVVGAGDLNNDTYPDLLLGKADGTTVAVSGQDYSTLHTYTAPGTGSQAGRGIESAGDINGDGFDDFVVGRMVQDSNRGKVDIISGKNGSLIGTISGGNENDYLGLSVAGIGDIDNDGIPEIIAGAYGDDDNGNDSGSVSIYAITVDSGAVNPDSDGDSFPDNTDNCPNIANPNQTNTDNDSQGNACDSDDDNDGLSDTQEANLGTNPLLADSDGDNVNDGDEINAGTDPTVNDSASATDTDGDTLTDADETNTHGTNINLIDTDSDGVNDGDEVAVGTDPTIANTDYIISFEDGLLASALTVIDGAGEWSADNSSATNGVYSLKANAINDNSNAAIRLNMEFAATQLVFNAKVSSEEGLDFLIVTLDEQQEVVKISGEQDWQEFTVDIPAGQHTIDFSYTKDDSLSIGADTAWIDHIRFTTASDAITPETDTDGDGLTDLNETNIHLTNPNYIDTDLDGVNDGDEIKQGSDPTFAQQRRVFDMEDGLIPTAMFTPTDADAGWSAVETPIQSGVISNNPYRWALKADTITHNQEAKVSFKGNFDGGTLYFQYKPRTEQGGDELQVSIDDEAPVFSSSGDGSWTNHSIEVPAGLHTITFSYFKNGNYSSADDTVFIDSITYDSAQFGATSDTDNDGLIDSDERTHNTDIYLADTDGDGASDGDEVNAGTDPRTAGSGHTGGSGSTTDKLTEGGGGGGSLAYFSILLFLISFVRRKPLVKK